MEILKRDALDHIDRVDHVAERLAHFATMRITHHRMQQNLRKGQRVGELESEHDHPRYPEEEDVLSGLEQRRRIEALEIIRLFWPAK